jgi:putative DNA primase/helicase
MKLYREHDYANLQENDVLYAYDPDTGIYNDNGRQHVRTTLTTKLEEQYRGHVMSEVIDHLKGRTTITQRDFGGPTGKIAAHNCVIDLQNETTLKHDPDNMFQSRLGTHFDPDADAPRWIAFLNDVVNSDTARAKLQEFAGYCLHHWGLPHHKALFLVGPTASGKSTFLDTINALLGHGTVSSLTPQQLTSERFGPAELFGRWANIRNDIPKSTVKNTGMFKEIIAGDPMKAEKKNKDPFFFEPTAKHLFSANQLPEMEVDDEAFFRRILLVPFPETIPKPERDKHLDDKLVGATDDQDDHGELPGILNWAIEGLQRLLASGSFTGDRSPGHTRDTWSKWGDSVTRFAQHAITDGDDVVPKGELYAAYLEYCRQESIPSDTQHSMTRQLKMEGFEDGRAYVDGDQKRVFQNVTLTGRGQELLEDARSSGDDSGGGSGSPTGLAGFD